MDTFGWILKYGGGIVVLLQRLPYKAESPTSRDFGPRSSDWGSKTRSLEIRALIIDLVAGFMSPKKCALSVYRG